MRLGYEILENKIGQALIDGIFQSFYYNGELSDKINVIFLKFDNWLHITTTDQTAVIEVDELKEIESWTNDNNTTAEFPLTKIEQEYPDFKYYIGKVLIDFRELTPIKFHEVCGLKLYFENEQTIIIYSDNNENSYITFDNKLPIDIIEKTEY